MAKVRAVRVYQVAYDMDEEQFLVGADSKEEAKTLWIADRIAAGVFGEDNELDESLVYVIELEVEHGQVKEIKP